MEEHNQDGWTVNRKLVLAELERLSEGQQKVHDDLTWIKSELAGFKVKIGLLSGFFGILGGVLVALAEFFSKK